MILYKEYAALASKVDHFPYKSSTIPFFTFKDGEIIWSKDKGSKIEILDKTDTDVYAAWPSHWSTELFIIDDKALARKILSERTPWRNGQTPSPRRPIRDSSRRESSP